MKKVISPSVFEVIDWFADVIGELSIIKFNDVVVGSLVASIADGVIWMIDGFARYIEVESIGKIVGGLDGADVASAFNATEGNVVVVGLPVVSIVDSSLQAVLNVVDIAIGFCVIML